MKSLNVTQNGEWHPLSTSPITSIKTQGPAEIEFNADGESRIRSVETTGQPFAVEYTESELVAQD